ncbi:MAG: hypothetical protein KDB23_16840 [Planctomycetales bacterium]|nr:hypothetical protein [Planctomycetales bacterium]
MQTKQELPTSCVCHPSLAIVWLFIVLAVVGSVPSVAAQDRSLIPPRPQSLLDSQESNDVNSDSTSGILTASVTPESEAKAAPATPKDPLLFESGSTRVKYSLDAVFQQSGVTGSWWNLSEQFAPDAGYKVDRAWAETWIKPGIRVDTSATNWLTLYGGVSYVGSGNIGEDVFEQGNRGLWGVEDAYLGARFQLPDEESSLNLSYGRQPYKIGSGMLISVGAMNGFERGATTTFARRAWEEAGIVKWTRGPLSLDGFYLNPNELRSGDTNTRLAGTRLELNPAPDQPLGIAYFHVFESIFPYVAAPIRLIPDGREGLNTLHVYGRWNPLKDDYPGWHVAGDYAHQWNDRIQMAADAYNAETGYAFAQLPLTPRLVYAFRSFSGDDPGTTRYEKFDPLFYEGSPPLWATGSNGSFSFLNSNVLAHRISLNLTLNPQNFMAFYYWHVRANEINSPVQFGQAGRISASGGEPQLVAGVPDPHLSDDFYVEYTRVISPQIFLTAGFAVSVPGQGLRELVDNPRTWTGGLVNLTVKY